MVRAVVAAALCFLAAVRSNETEPGRPWLSEKAKVYQRPADASLYVGSAMCKSCHEDTPTKDFYRNYQVLRTS